jgi:hypothetical protein
VGEKHGVSPQEENRTFTSEDRILRNIFGPKREKLKEGRKK